MSMRKTKIVGTIGPSSEQVDTLGKMIHSGLDVARLNFSHGDYQEHEDRIHNIRNAAAQQNKTVAILLDTKGPEIRTGSFKEGKAELREGETAYVSMKEVEGTAQRFSVTYDGLIDDVHPGSKILLDDGLIALEVLEIDKNNEDIKTKVLNSGIIKDKKGVNVPNVRIRLPGITDKDRSDIEFGINQGIDFIAASFIRRRSDILEIKEFLEAHNATHIHIIPKIENQEGIDNIDEILEVSDGLMVARGDLGVEIPAEDVPLTQKYLIEKCNNVGKPVITATQMLDSMERNPRPTRAEASDVANAIFDGTDAIMLSGETAAGDYPLEVVETMRNIAVKSESGLDHKMMLEKRADAADMTITDAISQSVTRNAIDLDVSGLVTSTESGYTARMIAKYRPKAPIIAVTSQDYVSRQLALAWGVHAVVGQSVHTTDEMLDNAIETGLKTNLFQRGDRVVITAGVPAGESGTTNLMKVHVIGDILAKGQGVGLRSAYGRAVIAKDSQQALDKVTQDSILVAYGTDRDMMPAIEKSAGIITVEGGLTSHAAVVGLSLGIPVIVGVEDAFDIISDHMDITIDGTKGDIYKGHTSVI